jgi:hypothetical protein
MLARSPVTILQFKSSTTRTTFDILRAHRYDMRKAPSNNIKTSLGILHCGQQKNLFVWSFRRIATTKHTRSCSHSLPHTTSMALRYKAYLFKPPASVSYRFQAIIRSPKASAKLTAHYRGVKHSNVLNANNHCQERNNIVHHILDLGSRYKRNLVCQEILCVH